MSSVHNTSRERLHTGWLGGRDAAQVPVPVHAHADARTDYRVADSPAASGTPGVSPRRWPRRLLRVVRDVAIGLALITAVPVVAAVRVGHKPMAYNTESLRARLVGAERWRVLMAPQDAAITPLQAGSALRALMTGPADGKFPLRGESLKADRVWQTRTLGADMFPQIRSPNSTVPAASAIIDIVRGGFSEREMAYLRDVAESPLWTAFDIVARAPQVDMIGGRYTLPFQGDATAIELPLLRFADTKALAQAGVSRAAYYLANGENARAEAALQSVVSFGFALIDNGTSATDAILGRVIVDIGRDGLRQFYDATEYGNRISFAALQIGQPTKGSLQSVQSLQGVRVANVDALQKALLSDVGNPQLPRAIRFESLRALSMSTCGSASGMLMGHSAEAQAAFAEAKRSLARYPSERAYIDLMMDTPNRIPAGEFGWRRSASETIVGGAAVVAGTVLQNPRIEGCTRVMGMYN